MAALAGEPWCFDGDQIARLTDWQILNIYFLPAVRRAEEFRREHGPTPDAPVAGHGRRREPKPGEPGYRGPPGEPGSPEHRQAIVQQAFMGVMGLSRDKAEALYERQLAQYHAEQAAKG